VKRSEWDPRGERKVDAPLPFARIDGTASFRSNSFRSKRGAETAIDYIEVQQSHRADRGCFVVALSKEGMVDQGDYLMPGLADADANQLYVRLQG
jgi:hypothetical protein